MGVLTLLEGEGGSEVGLEHGLALDGAQESGIDSLLVRDAAALNRLLLRDGLLQSGG